MKIDFENTFYVIGLVLYIIYSFYKSNVKRQARQSQMAAQRERQQQEEYDGDTQTHTGTNRSIFDEVLSSDLAMAFANNSYQATTDAQDATESLAQDKKYRESILDEQYSVLDQVTEEGVSAIQMAINNQGNTHQRIRTRRKALNEPFNLKKAVLYDAIMNRPYQY